MSEENKALVRRWFEEVWNRGRAEAIDEMFAEDGVAHGLAGDAGSLRGPAGFRPFHRSFRDAFPDIRVVVEDVIAEGDKVVSRYTSVATDTEGFMGRLPTGKVIRTPAIQIFRFSGGKIVESWAVRDDLKTLRQLGHVPLPETKPPAASPR